MAILRTVWNVEDLKAVGGAWRATSSIDWCEGNFQYSPLIAEFFNTVSNIAFVGLAMLGIHKVIQQRLPLRFAGAYFGMMIVGIGSALFHTTLQYSWQLTDELPMIVLATFVVFVLFDLSPGGERKRFWSKASAGAGFLVLFNAFFVYAYATFPNPLYHQLSFGTIQAISIFRGTYILYFAPSMLAPPHRFAQNLEARKLQSRGTLLFLLGFIAWNIDNLLCGVLTELKRRVGAPWNILLEFHAWWHLWTGLGVYAVVCGIEYITLCLRFNPDHFQVNYFGYLPWVGRTAAGWAALEKEELNGHAHSNGNGVSKKDL